MPSGSIWCIMSDVVNGDSDICASIIAGADCCLLSSEYSCHHALDVDMCRKAVVPASSHLYAIVLAFIVSLDRLFAMRMPRLRGATA
jgi:hypothetical protein